MLTFLVHEHQKLVLVLLLKRRLFAPQELHHHLFGPAQLEQLLRWPGSAVVDLDQIRLVVHSISNATSPLISGWILKHKGQQRLAVIDRSLHHIFSSVERVEYDKGFLCRIVLANVSAATLVRWRLDGNPSGEQ